MSFFFFINWGRKPVKQSPQTDINLSERMIILPGCMEVTRRRNDIVALNLDAPVNIKSSLQGIIDQINRQKGLAILSHPSYLIKPYSRRKLLKLRDYLGIEIYSPNKIPWPESTRCWDFILSNSPQKKIWGFSSDDMHDLRRDAGRAWIIVKAKERSSQSILDALRTGAFYSTTGPIIEDISLSHRSVHLSLTGECQMKFIGRHKRNLQISFGREAAYYIRPGDLYVRVEIKDLKHRKKAWTQPVFIDNGKIVDFNYPAEGDWLRGCIHIHTNRKGGTSPEKEVIEWYREHHYDFLAITEHNYIANSKIMAD